MTVDSDYELNWNKENIPVENTTEKSVKFRRSPSKRTVLGELTQFVSSGLRRMRISESDPLVEEQSKWLDVASSLCCDPEQDDESLMSELLGLCDWNDEIRRSESSPYYEETSDGSEDDEDEAFMSYIRNQRIPRFESKKAGRNLYAAPTLRELHFSALRFESQVSIQKAARVQAGSSDTPCFKEISKAYVQQCKGALQNTGFMNVSRSAVVNSTDTLEKAFAGVSDEDNDVVLATALGDSHSEANIYSALSNPPSDDLWTNVKFTL